MVIRVASASLWFIAIVWASNFASTFAGIPDGLGLVAAAAVAALIVFDPRRLASPTQVETDEPATPRRADLAPAAQTLR